MNANNSVRVLLSLLISFILQKTVSAQSIINSGHLDYLNRSVVLNGDTVGGIQIYAEFPDYRWVDDDDEGDLCVDDAARALVFYCRQYIEVPSDTTLKKIKRILRFLVAMQAENGYFYNFIYGDGTLNKTHQNSVPIASFWSWRAFWALSEMLHIPSRALDQEKELAISCIGRLLPNIEKLCSNISELETCQGIKVPTCIANLGGDQASILLIALCKYDTYKPGQPEISALIQRLSDALLMTQAGTDTSFPYHAFLSWKNYWHAWGNSQAYALMLASQRTQEKRYLLQALQEVDHFYPYLLSNGFISGFSLLELPDGRQITESISEFSQIAYGLRPMVFAAVEGYKITGDKKYLEIATKLCSWLFGNNAAKTKMYDIKTGRTYDGIQNATSVNRNAGAESTIESLLALQKLASVPEGLSLLEKLSNDISKMK